MKNKIEINEQERIKESLYRYVGYRHCENVAREFDEISELAKDIEYPKELDDWFTEYIDNAKKTEKKVKRMVTAKRIAIKAAMAAVVLGIGIALMTFSVDALRIRVLNFLIDTTQRYTNIQVVDETNEQGKVTITWSNYYLPEYIIDGYSIISFQELGESKIIYYRNARGEEIQFSQSPGDNNYQINTEDTEATEVKINDTKGILSEKNGVITLLWHDSRYTFFIIGKADKEEIVKMAESTKLIKK